ncbi:DUF2306 domain-containing protein [Actinokineospora auranticolor]|uniref:Putative membrane protein DUF2306 n=1 Tax=Actinokineospora auranticolor TaxID=155976 RepID=A0A2S6GT02_9PSEU|nr:DUF2306 domain-containing protein [Actinokineospora auranticolor]PPK68319.1 putative membrane protein DUF2306 [Actinokineospora auranticolor]
MTPTPLRRLRLPLALVALSLIPVAAGAFRLSQLAGGAAVTTENARFFAAPIPVALHIVGATVFCVGGAFQFMPGLRRTGWHRRAGRVILPCGLIAALSGLWMTATYDLPAHDGPLLAAFRVIFGTGMAVALVLGFLAIRRGHVAAHRAWLTRAYAIGVAAGTQALTTLPWVLVAGQPGEVPRALLLGAAWGINLAVAECAIRGVLRTPRTRATPTPATL